MRRRNFILAVLLTASVMAATALAARAEPDETTAPLASITTAGPSEMPTAWTTSPDGSATSTVPTTTVDYDATDVFGSTLYAPTTTTTTTTTKKTSRTPSPWVVNPAYPDDTDAREPGYAPLPNLYVRVTDEHGNYVTVPVAPTTTMATTEASTQESYTRDEDEEGLAEFTEEAEGPGIRWALAAGVGAVLLAALAGVIIMTARGRRGGEDDYIYTEE